MSNPKDGTEEMVCFWGIFMRKKAYEDAKNNVWYKKVYKTLQSLSEKKEV